MRVFLTNKQAITSKTGEKYVKYDSIGSDGRAQELFLSAAKADEYEIADSLIIPEKDIAEFLENYDSVDVFYDNRGRIDSIQA